MDNTGWIDNLDTAGREALGRLEAQQPFLWLNPTFGPYAGVKGDNPFTAANIEAVAGALEWFAPLLAACFDDTRLAGGLVESPLRGLPAFEEVLRQEGLIPDGRLLLKMDSELPIAGSIKARGGVYEVLAHARRLAQNAGLLAPGQPATRLLEPELREFFGRHTVQAGSTGNLGISIGTVAAALGFKAVVHMAADAKQWKKDLLRGKGVKVVEYTADYGKAVAGGRKASLQDPYSHFVDDENSADLFLGYAVAAGRLKAQLDESGAMVDEDHPLFVYLPCGIGGAPGGITFGLKELYGDAVHCFFAEPTGAPCMLLGLLSGLHDGIAVQDIGLSGKTEADGLAVGRASGLVGKAVGRAISGVYTLEDAVLLPLLRSLHNWEGHFIEASACAALAGPQQLCSAAGQAYLAAHRLQNKMQNATHLLWATGGSMVPDEVRKGYLEDRPG